MSVRTTDGSLFGDLWFASWGGVIFRWNGDDEDGDGLAVCGFSETIGATPFCLWGEGPWAPASDGTISGRINGGVYFAEQRCVNQSHRFALRPKPDHAPAR